MAILQGANLQGVRMVLANLEGASLMGCNFEDPHGRKANMEGTPNALERLAPHSARNCCALWPKNKTTYAVSFGFSVYGM